MGDKTEKVDLSGRRGGWGVGGGRRNQRGQVYQFKRKRRKEKGPVLDSEMRRGEF